MMLNKGLTKAQTLEYVSTKLTLFRVPELIYFTIANFRKAPFDTIEKINSTFSGRTIAVRSSAADEDGVSNAAAGEYESVLNVLSNDSESLLRAIQTVIRSIELKRECSLKDEIIIQEMVAKSNMSGVIFTHDLNTGAPYYVINYDDASGLTNTVTSGDNEYANRTLYVYRKSLTSLRSNRFYDLLNATLELEEMLDTEFLDIEFALDCNLKPCLLQVRPITTQKIWDKSVSKEIDNTLIGVQSFIQSRFDPQLGVYGETTVLGQMPDWNPVEMIGRAPRALAFSLYKLLITDNAWRIAREKMGYAVPKGQPLMVSLAGQPFIDTRLSFHSFLPKSVSPKIGTKLVNVWLDRLKNQPALHDKVEFDVAITTFSFDIDDKIERLIGPELSDQEKADFKGALLQQTRVLLMEDGDYSLKDAIGKLEELTVKQTRYKQIPHRKNLSDIFNLIDDCIHLGTIPFSILARHGFIAKTILLSLVELNIFSSDDADRFQSSFKTVASEFVDDGQELKQGRLSESKFLLKYGHLRPGTYDILSPRYDQMGDSIVGAGINKMNSTSTTFTLSTKQKEEINYQLTREGFYNMDADGLMEYIRVATVGREYGKFVFSRTVSDILELIASYGENNGLNRDQMSHIGINDLLDITQKSRSSRLPDYLLNVSESNAKLHSLSRSIRLPQVLFDEAGVFVVPFQVSTPNFITNKNITAPILSLDSRVDVDVSLLHEKIILIESADPGFDWIFAQNIGGLITKYGGANSHMAIRCAEFGIPAAIGCGEQRFEAIRKFDRCFLDCASGLIDSLN